MMGKTKRIIGIFFSLVLVLGIVPLFGFTSEAVSYCIKIGQNGGVIDRTSGASGPGWSYAPPTDSENATLTLTNANISGEYGIYSSYDVGNINIVLVGDNTIESTAYEGIYVENVSLTISGEGTLTVNGNTDGIFASSVTIDDATVTVRGNGENGHGINTYNGVGVNGGNVDISGKSCGIYVGSSSVSINGGVVKAGSSEDEFGIIAYNLRVKSGTDNFIAVGKEKALDCSNSLMNEIPGAGWSNAEGTEGKAEIAVNKNPGHSQEELGAFKMVQFPVEPEPEPVPQQPKVVEGANQIVSAGSAATFVINKDFDKFQNNGSVEVDGKEVDSKYYKAESGSTIITLKEEFTKTLPEGIHKLAVKFGDETEANTTFTIVKESPSSDPSADSGTATSPTNTDNTMANDSSESQTNIKAPKTSDTSPMGAIILIIIGICTIGVVYRRRKL